jgi:nitroreductase
MSESNSTFNMSIVEAMETQRAIRRVKFDEVDDKLIMQLIELGTRAPTAMNNQDWEFIVVKDQAVKNQLGKQNRFMWNLVRSFMRKREKNHPGFDKVNDATQWGVDNFENYPAMIVACYKGPRVHLFPVQASAFYGSILPAAQNILLGARAMNLGANLSNMPLWFNRRARKILGLPSSITPVVLITLGWPLGKYGPNKRKPVGDVVSFNQYGTRPYHGKTAAEISV